MATSDFYLRKYEETYKEGDIIFYDGDLSKEMYFVLEGNVRIYKEINEQIQTFALLDKGDFFGEMSTFVNDPRIATAVAEEDCRLLVVHPKLFEAMIKNHPEYGLKVIKALCERIKNADQQIEALKLKS